MARILMQKNRFIYFFWLEWGLQVNMIGYRTKKFKRNSIRVKNIQNDDNLLHQFHCLIVFKAFFNIYVFNVLLILTHYREIFGYFWLFLRVLCSYWAFAWDDFSCSLGIFNNFQEIITRGIIDNSLSQIYRSYKSQIYKNNVSVN